MKDILSWTYLFVAVVLFLYGFHFYVILFLYHRGKKQNISKPKKIPSSEDQWPQVTIQLPVFNEYNVIERLIENTLKMVYPKEKLHIQVLDDSTDETRHLTQQICENYIEKGFDIQYSHRTNREGYKAGALKEGLKTAKGEFVAIFDADFIPNENFLQETIPYFLADSGLGLVQTRWDYYNRDYSLLTHLQAVALDGHFMIEQKARSDNGLWFNFNGTAGIWRKECIFDAGNWMGDTLTEDLDLSYRAQIKGWHLLYYREVGNLSELPITIPAYKTQQFRWAKGAFQCARKLVKKIIHAKTKWSSKLEAMVHLINYGAYLFITLNYLLILPMAIVSANQEYDIWDTVPWYLAVVFFALGLLGPVVYFFKSQRERKLKALVTLRNIFALLVINFGLTFMIFKAFLEALFKRKSAFVRTPKFNLTSKKETNMKKHYSMKVEFLTILEILGFLYGAYTVTFCSLNKLYGVAFFAFLYTLGFFWISFGTLRYRFAFAKKMKVSLHERDVQI